MFAAFQGENAQNVQGHVAHGRGRCGPGRNCNELGRESGHHENLLNGAYILARGQSHLNTLGTYCLDFTISRFHLTLAFPMRIILVHGYKASPQTNFWPWLKRELTDRRFDVVMPELPNPAEPDRDAWTKALLEAVGTLDENDIIVGHSLGGASALRLLEAAEARTTPHACVLISTPWMIKDDRFRSFFLTELDHDVLMWRAAKYVVVHAKDDTVIPVSHADRYAQVFYATQVLPETGGHFEGTEQPEILDAILKVAAEPVVFEPGMSLADEFADITK